jgi:hypothetical protein
MRDSRREPTIRLGSGEHAVFGYGSLMLRESMERSLGHAYDGPFIDCAVRGWRRTWDVAMPNETIAATDGGDTFIPRRILYLNVHPDPATTVNGSLFVVNEAELASFDRREWIYARVAITAALVGVHVEGGEAYLYAGLPEHEWPGGGTNRDYAIRETYLELVEAALARRSEEFRERYDASTDEVPAQLVVADVVSTVPYTTVRLGSPGGRPN